MQQPPPDALRIDHRELEPFIQKIALAVGLSDEHAGMLARLLIENDLRGVLSHGSQQIVRYAREIQSGQLNPKPNVTLLDEGPTSAVLDGDGGLGYFPAYDATRRVIGKACEHGMAAAVTRNHGHIGAAGIYARLPLAHDLLTFVTSGVQLNLKPGDLVYEAAGQSPMSFSAPAGEEPPLVVDAGVMHDFQGRNPPYRDAIARLAPGVALRAIGMGSICQAWGGLLTGLRINGEPAWKAANQGAMLFACKISLFADPQAFKREMDAYVRKARELTPIEGTEGAHLPGDIEAAREKNYRQHGIPLSDRHQQRLEELAGSLNVPTPWR